MFLLYKYLVIQKSIRNYENIFVSLYCQVNDLTILTIPRLTIGRINPPLDQSVNKLQISSGGTLPIFILNHRKFIFYIIEIFYFLGYLFI